jgi:predicted alpha/beta hydrolase family esterase
MKTQVMFIHGGMTFRNKKDYLDYLKTRSISIKKKIKWTDDYLEENLGEEFQIIKPRMPLSENAKYNEWKINFERYFPYLKNNIILIGYSLGGIFLAKYLSENKFPKKILSAYLICPPFDDTSDIEALVGGFKLKNNLFLLENQCKNIYLMFSKNDPLVTIEHVKKYSKKLGNSKIIIYKNKNGHFKISRFPEIIKLIKKDVEKNKKLFFIY